jgi:Trm5-related predicted tRNA methylase
MSHPPDDVNKIKAQLDAALGVVRSYVRDTAHCIVTVAKQLDPRAVILLQVN